MDPHHLDADSDPAFHFDADPDPAIFTVMRIRIRTRILPFTQMQIRIQILLFNLMRIRILPLTFFQIWTLQAPMLQNDPPRLPTFHCDAYLNPDFRFDADPNLPFDFDAGLDDPDPASPAPQY